MEVHGASVSDGIQINGPVTQLNFVNHGRRRGMLKSIFCPYVVGMYICVMYFFLFFTHIMSTFKPYGCGLR